MAAFDLADPVYHKKKKKVLSSRRKALVGLDWIKEEN